ALRQAQDREPDHPRGRLLEARLAAAHGDWKAALEAALACRQHHSSRKQAHLLAADACGRLGQPARAAEMLSAARGLPGAEPWRGPLVGQVERLRVGARARLDQARALAEAGRPGEAAELLEALVRDHPREVRGWLLLAQLRRGQRGPDAAERV